MENLIAKLSATDKAKILKLLQFEEDEVHVDPETEVFRVALVSTYNRESDRCYNNGLSWTETIKIQWKPEQPIEEYVLTYDCSFADWSNGMVDVELKEADPMTPKIFQVVLFYSLIHGDSGLLDCCEGSFTEFIENEKESLAGLISNVF